MQFVNYVSSLAMPSIILIIVVYGIVEKIKIFDVFLEGAKDGIEIVISIFSYTYRVVCSNWCTKKFRYFRFYYFNCFTNFK